MLRLLIIFGSGFDMNLFEEWPKINGLGLDIIGSGPIRTTFLKKIVTLTVFVDIKNRKQIKDNN